METPKCTLSLGSFPCPSAQMLIFRDRDALHRTEGSEDLVLKAPVHATHPGSVWFTHPHTCLVLYICIYIYLHLHKCVGICNYKSNQISIYIHIDTYS